jgi:hypothetical protein
MAYKGEEPRVAESSTSVGAGDFVLAGAITERVRFSAVCAVGDTFDYVIKAADGTWEEGFGTYSAANTLTRTTVKRSSNANAAVIFAAGNKTVFINFAGLSRAIAEADQKNPPTGADKLGIWDSVTGLLAGLTLTNLAGWLASLAQTLSSKTLTTPVINGATGSTALWNIGAGQIYKETTGKLYFGGTSAQPGADWSFYGSASAVLSVSAITGTAYLQLYNQAGSTDLKFSRIGNGGGGFSFQKVNDAYSVATVLGTLDGSGFSANGVSTSTITAAATSGYAALATTASGTNNSYVFLTNATSGERCRITADNSANLSFSTGTSAVTQAAIIHTASAVNYLAMGGAVTGSAPYLSATGTDTNVGLNLTTRGTGAFTWYSGNFGTSLLNLSGAGVLTPGADNTQTLGSASFRWSTVYAGTGTINTSDAREKTAVSPLTEGELAAAKDMARELGGFKFLDSVAEKGDKARTHIGMTVQRGIEIMKGHGLNPTSYAFICYDKWDAVTKDVVSPSGAESREVTRQMVDMVESQTQVIEVVDGVPVQKQYTETQKVPRIAYAPVVNEQGQPVMTTASITHELFDAAGEKVGEAEEEVVVPLLHIVPVMETVIERFDVVEVSPAGDRYGFRADELHAFILRGLLAALETP